MPIAALLATLAGIAGSLELMWGAFAVGGALLCTSVLLLRWPWSIWNAAPPVELPPRTRRAALLAVFAVAAFFRFYRLDPPGLWGDDAINGLLAFDVVDGKIRSPFQIVPHSHSFFHALSNYPIAAAFWLFGPGPTTLRLPGVVFGTLCDVLLYATVSPLFGCRTALLAALFFASSPPQIMHAKELVQVITGQFFQLAGLCLLVRGMTARRSWLIAGAGLPLALCIYTYHAARIAPLVAAAYVAATWLAGRRAPDTPLAVAQSPAEAPTPSRRSGWAFAAALLVFAIALLPAWLGYQHDPGALVQRISATSVWPLVLAEHSLRPLWDSVWRTLLIFHYQQGPEFHWFGIGVDPAVNAVIGFLFLHGLVESLRRWRQPRHILLLAWFAVGLLPALASTEAPRVYRAFLATPPIYVWAALPLVQLLAVPARQAARRALLALAGALAIAVPLIDFNYYFYRVYTHPSFRWFQGERIVEMARTLRAFGPGWTGYLLSDTFEASHESLLFLARAWGLQIVDVASLSAVLPLQVRPEKGAVFMMSYGAFGAAPAIEQMYPGVEPIVRREPPVRSWWFDAWWPIARHATPQESTAMFYPVGSAEAARPQLVPAWGLRVQYSVGHERFERFEPYPFYQFLRHTFAQSFDATWRGRLTIPDDGPYRIIVANNGTATLLVDGGMTTAQDAVASGEHQFELRLREVPADARLKIFWQRDGGTRALIPPAAFAPARSATAQRQD